MAIPCTHSTWQNPETGGRLPLPLPRCGKHTVNVRRVAADPIAVAHLCQAGSGARFRPSSTSHRLVDRRPTCGARCDCLKGFPRAGVRLMPCALVAALCAQVQAQVVRFDFQDAPLHASLPISLTAGGFTARFTASGQGFSIQEANTMGFTPAGFSGLCLYPNSVFAADLEITFSEAATNFLILYAPQELACDSSARMRVTAYLDAATVGTSTTTADPPGTWPSATLVFSSAQGFTRVVVHYDAPPPTGGDWGPIFMADNLAVTLGPPVLQWDASALPALTVHWPASAEGYVLQHSPDLHPGGWQAVTNAVDMVGNQKQSGLSASEARGFYRLFHP